MDQGKERPPGLFLGSAQHQPILQFRTRKQNSRNTAVAHKRLPHPQQSTVVHRTSSAVQDG